MSLQETVKLKPVEIQPILYFSFNKKSVSLQVTDIFPWMCSKTYYTENQFPQVFKIRIVFSKQQAYIAFRTNSTKLNVVACDITLE